MKKYIIFTLLISLCFMQRGENRPHRGGDNPNKDNKKQNQFQIMSDEAKQLFYQTEKISPEQAFLYQLSLPLPFVNLGYAYSDNWARGIKWDLAIIGAILLGDYIEDEECDQFNLCISKNQEAQDVIGFAIIGLSIYKMVDVYQTAERYNNKLFRKTFGRKKPSFALGYSSDIQSPLLSMSIP